MRARELEYLTPDGSVDENITHVKRHKLGKICGNELLSL